MYGVPRQRLSWRDESTAVRPERISAAYVPFCNMPSTSSKAQASADTSAASRSGKRARDEPSTSEDAGSSGCENGDDGNGVRRSGRERSTVERYVPSSVVNGKKVRTRAPPRFHITPSNEWQWLVKKMNISVRNTLEWRTGTPLPIAPSPASCWLLPCKDDTAVQIGTHAEGLAANGWKLLTCPGPNVARIGNKHNLFQHAKALGLLAHLPQHYATPVSAKYPCMLKAHAGEHGQGIYIVRNEKEVASKAGASYDGSQWLLQVRAHSSVAPRRDGVRS